LDRARGDTPSGKIEVAMNHLFTLGFMLLLAALAVIRNVMTVTNALIRL
jgi:hypothetical protein